jgi:plasmid stabilization system protein ParE
MISRCEVVFSRSAKADVRRIAKWWRANRSKAPDLFDDELVRAIDLLETAPMIPALARDPKLQDVRRILLRTGHHVYFRIREDQVDVLAVWPAAKPGPRIE